MIEYLSAAEYGELVPPIVSEYHRNRQDLVSSGVSLAEYVASCLATSHPNKRLSPDDLKTLQGRGAKHYDGVERRNPLIPVP